MSAKKKSDKEFTWSTKILLTLLIGVDLLPRPFESKSRYVRRLFSGRLNVSAYHTILTRLERRGLITIYKNGECLLPALTKRGMLRALFEKARIPISSKWDGKWRMLLFDIPENARSFRHELRVLLRQNGFKLIQKSVYLSPYALNAAALRYLKETKLDEYIRIFRIDKADDEQSLKHLFHVK